MLDYLHSDYISEEKIKIDDIPAILLRPKNTIDKLATIIFYHGWSSSKELQRLRGLIYAMVGFQVLLPDAIYHGDRNPIDYNDIKNSNYFWKTIFSNLEESNKLIERLINNYNASPDNITVAGNSMGGFTAAGVFTHNSKIKNLLVFNGSCAWGKSTEMLLNLLDIEMNAQLRELENKISKLDPINHLDLLKDRNILILHGVDDSLVSVDAQRLFMDRILPLYEDKRKIKYIEYPNLNHFVTTNMMEESIAWLK